MTRFTSSQPIAESLPWLESDDSQRARTWSLDFEFLFFFLFDVEIELILIRGTFEENLFFVLLGLRNFALFLAAFFLLARLRFVLARAHLRRLRGAADVAVLARVVEQRALEHLPPAIQTRHHRADRTVENLRDLFVREALDVREQNDHLVVVRQRVEGALHILVHH